MGGRRFKVMKVLGNYWRVDYYPTDAPAFCDYHQTSITAYIYAYKYKFFGI